MTTPLSETLDAFNIALTRIEKRGIVAVQKLMQPARQDVATAFEAERYHNDAGKAVPLGAFGRAWREEKKRLGLDSRKGHAYGGLQKTFAKKSAAKKTPKGFILDFNAAAATSRGRKIRGRKARPLASSYIRHYAARKAPTLGALSTSMRKQLRDALINATREGLQRATRSAALGAQGGFIEYNLAIESFGFAA